MKYNKSQCPSMWSVTLLICFIFFNRLKRGHKRWIISNVYKYQWNQPNKYNTNYYIRSLLGLSRLPLSNIHSIPLANYFIRIMKHRSFLVRCFDGFFANATDQGLVIIQRRNGYHTSENLVTRVPVKFQH